LDELPVDASEDNGPNSLINITLRRALRCFG
jgi:hypothetical protein